LNLLTLDNITKAYTDRKLFDRASFYLQEGDKIGIVGINGTGKSTLLKIMAGLETPDEGEVIKANHVVIRFLSQSPEFVDTDTVLKAVLRENVNHHNEWTIESDAKTILTKLGITNFDQPISQLSGGQRKRIALASVLLAPTDILVLDEPTNHLDNDMNDWLEDYLKKWKGSLVMVTHDRYFLDSISNCIVEIDKGQIYRYQTNYSGYIELKAERDEMNQASERKRQSILKTELVWIQRGARARSTKQKSRIERFDAMKNLSGPVADEKVILSSVSSRMGKTTVELDHITKGYDGRILIKDFSYIFLKEDRIGFIGSNGSGKTTLMKIIAGKLQQDSGERIVGQTVKIGYYTQEIDSGDGGVLNENKSSKEYREQLAREDANKNRVEYMNPAIRVIDYIKDIAEYVQTEDGSISASQMLERFLFTPDQQYSPIGKLSGGEKRRLNLLKVLVDAPNVLVMDEPTNDLDITTLTILEDYLDHFPGIVITVSHDRYFLDRTVKRIFAFGDNGSIKQYEGGYTDYTIRRTEEEEEQQVTEILQTSVSNKTGGTTVNIQDNKGNRPKERKLKFTFQEQKDYETIEQDIAGLEEKLEKLENDILASSRDFVKLNEFTGEKEKTEQQLEEKMQRWMYLEDLASQIANQGKE